MHLRTFRDDIPGVNFLTDHSSLPGMGGHHADRCGAGHRGAELFGKAGKPPGAVIFIDTRRGG